MIKDGLLLMVMGMGTVFVFLCIMIFVMNIVGSLFAKFVKPEELPVPAKVASCDESEIAAAVVVAKVLGR